MSAVINEALRRTSAMSAERRQQRFYEGGQDYLERRRESARLSRQAVSHSRPRSKVVDLDSRSGGYEDLPSTA